ncbi:endogenous retrovirus group 3 member 1 Env polyprotein-like [Anomaloglossus baeobatrachus]
MFINGTSETCSNISGNLMCNDYSEYRANDPTCNNPDVGYCSPIGQQPGWCLLSNVSIFVDLVHRLVLQHSALWDLPRGMYWVCGYNAYKWLPVGVKGSCTLARLTPATFIVPYDQLDAQVLPKHMIFKRAADNKPRESGRPHVVQMGTANKIFSTFFLYPMIMQMWDKLVESTDYLDDQIFAVLDIVNTSVAVQQQLIIVTNQHTLVLDYLTAAQGGMCQIIGPACCHYIDPKGQLQLRAKLNDIQKLRDKYQKDNDRYKFVVQTVPKNFRYDGQIEVGIDLLSSPFV